MVVVSGCASGTWLGFLDVHEDDFES
jgi:hypothetical protein